MAFLDSVVSILYKYIQSSMDRSTKVVDFLQPNELWKEYDFTIPDEPMKLEQLLIDCRECLRHQVRTGE